MFFFDMLIFFTYFFTQLDLLDLLIIQKFAFCLILYFFSDILHMLRPHVCPPLEIWKPYTFIMMSDLRPVYPSKEKRHYHWNSYWLKHFPNPLHYCFPLSSLCRVLSCSTCGPLITFTKPNLKHISSKNYLCWTFKMIETAQKFQRFLNLLNLIGYLAAVFNHKR